MTREASPKPNLTRPDQETDPSGLIAQGIDSSRPEED